jgi:O-antigen ligase
MIFGAYFFPNSWYLFNLLGLFFIFLMLVFFKYKKINFNPLKAVNFYLLLMIICIFIGQFSNWFLFAIDLDSIFTSDKSSSIATINTLSLSVIIIIFCSFILIRGSSFSEKDIYSILYAVLLCGVISAIITLVSWAIDTGAQWGRYNYTPPITNSQGLQLYSLIFAFFSGMVLINTPHLSSKNNIKLIKLYCLILVFCMTTILVREAWIIFLVALILAYLKTSKVNIFIKYTQLSFLIIFISIALTIAINSNNLISDISLSNGFENAESIYVRFQMVENAISFFLDNPLFGIGYGNFSSIVTYQVELQSSGAVIEVSSPHNGLILILAETGLFGLLTLILFMISIFSSLKKMSLYNDLIIKEQMFKVFKWFLILLFFDQMIANSMFLPTPSEVGLVKLSWLLWIIIALMLSSTINLSKCTKKKSKGLL